MSREALVTEFAEFRETLLSLLDCIYLKINTGDARHITAMKYQWP
jgi:hypothetical protein